MKHHLKLYKPVGTPHSPDLDLKSNIREIPTILAPIFRVRRGWALLNALVMNINHLRIFKLSSI